MNVACSLERAAFHFSNHIAVFEDDKQVTYRQFNQEANRFASALMRTGVCPGDHVAICMPNSFAWLAVYYGILKTGAVAVTLPCVLFEHELMKLMMDCEPKVLFIDSAKQEHFDLFKQNTGLKLIISDAGGDLTFEAFSAEGSTVFKIIEREPDDTCAILYTGGTTGLPKGAMLSHLNISTSLYNVAYNERSEPSDIALCFLPLNHVFAQIHIVQSTVFSCGGLVILPCFDMDRIFEVIHRYGITKFYAVPTIYIRFLRHENLKEKMGSVRYCFSAATSMATEIIHEWKTRTGLDIYEAYGMTESASMVSYNHHYRHVIGSVGTPVHLVEIKIMDAEGNEMEQGNNGEICIRGPNMTKGYLKNSAESQEAFWGDWFRSGDMGRLDEDGYLYIVDRLKDMIITGGENVYPREIEELLYTCEEVLECAVVGFPDKEYGERVTAVIVTKNNMHLDKNALKMHLKSQLAGFKVPKEYIVVDELPKNSTGKILKREINPGQISRYVDCRKEN